MLVGYPKPGNLGTSMGFKRMHKSNEQPSSQKCLLVTPNDCKKIEFTHEGLVYEIAIRKNMQVCFPEKWRKNVLNPNDIFENQLQNSTLTCNDCCLPYSHNTANIIIYWRICVICVPSFSC